MFTRFKDEEGITPGATSVAAKIALTNVGDSKSMMSVYSIPSKWTWQVLRVNLLTLIMLFVSFSPSSALSEDSSLAPLQIETTSTTASIEAHRAPLADILRALGVQMGFEVVAQDPGPTRSLSLKHVPLAKALEQLLLGVNFVIEYAKPTDDVRTTPPTIATIYLLSEVSPEIAEQERATREASQVQTAIRTTPQPTDQIQKSPGQAFSSESSLLEPNSSERAVSFDSSGTRSLAASQRLQEQLNPLQGVPPDPPSQEPAVWSGQQVPFSLQQQALEQVRALADKLETARQQLSD